MVGSYDATEEGEGLTDWGMPLEYDGHAPIRYIVYVPTPDSLSISSWDALLSAPSLDWVVIPILKKGKDYNASGNLRGASQTQFES